MATRAQIGDSVTGLPSVAGSLAALYQREHPAAGSRDPSHAHAV